MIFAREWRKLEAESAPRETLRTRGVLEVGVLTGHSPQHITFPPVNMAALTFNPLVLSAKASVRGAAVRRSVAVKASKKAAFAVRADDDMDFVSGVPGPFSFSSHPGA